GTPDEYTSTLADGLGPFSLLVNLFNQLQDRSIQASIDERRQLGEAPAKEGFYDAMQSSARADPTSPTPQVTVPEESGMEDIEMLDAEYASAPDPAPHIP